MADSMVAGFEVWVATAGSHALGDVTCFVVRIFPPAALPALFIAADSGGHVGDHPPICAPITPHSFPLISPLLCFRHSHRPCPRLVRGPAHQARQPSAICSQPKIRSPLRDLVLSLFPFDVLGADSLVGVCRARPEKIGTNDVLLGCSFAPSVVVFCPPSSRYPRRGRRPQGRR